MLSKRWMPASLTYFFASILVSSFLNTSWLSQSSKKYLKNYVNKFDNTTYSDEKHRFEY